MALLLLFVNSAPLAPPLELTASGTLGMSGTAPVHVVHGVTASGALPMAGSAAITLQGSTPTSVVHAVSASGSLSLSGSASVVLVSASGSFVAAMATGLIGRHFGIPDIAMPAELDFDSNHPLAPTAGIVFVDQLGVDLTGRRAEPVSIVDSAASTTYGTPGTTGYGGLFGGTTYGSFGTNVVASGVGAIGPGMSGARYPAVRVPLDRRGSWPAATLVAVVHVSRPDLLDVASVSLGIPGSTNSLTLHLGAQVAYTWGAGPRRNVAAVTLSYGYNLVAVAVTSAGALVWVNGILASNGVTHAPLDFSSGVPVVEGAVIAGRAILHAGLVYGSAMAFDDISELAEDPFAWNAPLVIQAGAAVPVVVSSAAVVPSVLMTLRALPLVTTSEQSVFTAASFSGVASQLLPYRRWTVRDLATNAAVSFAVNPYRMQLPERTREVSEHRPLSPGGTVVLMQGAETAGSLTFDGRCYRAADLAVLRSWSRTNARVEVSDDRQRVWRGYFTTFTAKRIRRGTQFATEYSATVLTGR